MTTASDRRRTFGRGGTAAGWTAGQRETTRSNAKGRQPAARLDNPTVEEAREMVASQWCWWCGRGPWRSLVGHTALAHGIKSFELRNLALLKGYERLISDELHEEMRLRPQTAQQIGLRAAQASTTPKRRKVFTEAGRQVNATKIAAFVTPEMRRRAGLAAAAKSKRPHYCTAGCGTWIPRAHPLTCSPACRKLVRQQTARAVLARRYETD